MRLLTPKVLAIGALLASTAAFPTFAQQVTLKSNNGAFAMAGELQSFDGETFVLRTKLGDISVSSAEVTCEGAECPDMSFYMKEFTVAGSDTIVENLMPSLLDAFSRASGYRIISTLATSDGSVIEMLDSAGEPVATITLVSNGSSGGISALTDGSATLALSTRGPTPSESAAIAAAGLGDVTRNEQQLILALDGLEILVSPENPVQFLSVSQIADIFAGRISNWSEVGGRNAPITVYRRANSSSSTELLRAEIMAQKASEIVGSSITVAPGNTMGDFIVSNANGIGYASLTDATTAKPISVRGDCGIISEPNSFNFKTEDYPLTSRLMVFSPDATMPAVAGELLAFLGSEAAQAVVADLGFVSSSLESVNVADQGYRFVNAIQAAVGDDEVSVGDLADMTNRLLNAERLTTTFRFDIGTSSLDARAEAEIARFVGMMGEGVYDGKEVMLVGFTDSVGQADVNAELAQQRAEQVLQRIRATAAAGSLDDVLLTAVGMGEISPMACNDAPRGRFVNRRIEVWTRDRG